MKKAPRNPVARSPLMRKGGVHEKSKSSQRRSKREELISELEALKEDLEFEQSIKVEKRAADD